MLTQREITATDLMVDATDGIREAAIDLRNIIRAVQDGANPHGTLIREGYNGTDASRSIDLIETYLRLYRNHLDRFQAMQPKTDD